MTAGRIALAVTLLSAGGLLFEIALTRLLSVLYFSTFSYLVLSLSVLGLALGAALAALFPGFRVGARWHLWAALAGFSALLVTALAPGAATAPVRYLLIPLGALPYLFLGLALTGIFAERWAASSRLYLADLAGAGIGALLAVPLLDLAGALSGMQFAAAALAFAALLLTPRSVLSLACVVTALAVLALQLTGTGLTLDLSRLNTPKPIRSSLRSGGEIVATRWDSFARSDLVRMPGERFLIYLDGGAASLVPHASLPESWLGDVGALAFAVSDPEEVFLIGPGGGLDIALARHFGAQRIVAAEVNRGAVEFTRSLSSYAGDLYGRATELTIDDGRSALHRSSGEFDLILLSQVVTQAAEARGLALAENGLYTVEAFGEYFDRLSADGVLAIKLYDELTLTRALVTALQALEERGVAAGSAARHLFAALDTRASPPVPLLLVSRQELAFDEAVAWARTAEQRGLGLLFVPGLLAPPALEPVLSGEAGAERIVGAAEDVDLRPTRDYRPYFYQFERGLPRSLRPLLLAVLGILLLSLLLTSVRARRRGPPVRAAPWLFGALGAGFMLVEISVLQRAQLLIGHPTVALTTVLAALLLGAAAGSGLSQRVAAGREFRWVARASLLAALLVTGWSFALPLLEGAMRGLPSGSSALLAALVLVPLAVPMGAPFPLSLRALGGVGPTEVAIAWSLNGVASVAGAVGATALAIVFGLGLATLLGAALYLCVAALAFTLPGSGSA